MDDERTPNDQAPFRISTLVIDSSLGLRHSSLVFGRAVIRTHPKRHSSRCETVEVLQNSLYFAFDKITFLLQFDRLLFNAFALGLTLVEQGLQLQYLFFQRLLLQLDRLKEFNGAVYLVFQISKFFQSVVHSK